MYSATIQNRGGEALELTGHEDQWQVVSITGLNPPPARVNLTDIAGLDGSRFNSSKLNTLNIVVTLRVRGDAEANRLRLYQFFRTKELCRFFFENGSRDVYIDGYVETVESDLFSMAELVQASIICPDPMFRSVAGNVVDISDLEPLFSFPFAINSGSPVAMSTFTVGRETAVVNASESVTGMEITVTFLGDVNKLKIICESTGEYIELTYAFQEADVVVINTNPGQKSVTLHRSGTETNIFGALSISSTFMQLEPGANVFSYTADTGDSDGDVVILVTFNNAFRGV